jgi:serine/threonine-protein kinase
MVYNVASGRLYLRSMSALEAKAISGIETGTFSPNPVFSPDGRSIAFYSSEDGTLKKIAVSGGAAVTLCPADQPFGMSWETDGIVFGQGNKGVMRISANGGKPDVLVNVKPDELAHGPHMLPDGQTVLFTLATGTGPDRWDKARIVLQTLKSGARKTLIEGGSDARYLPTGHLVYAVSGVLFAVPFDLQRLEVRGGPVSIVEGVQRVGAFQTGSAQFSVSATGSLMYIPSPVSTSTARLTLGLFDQKGGGGPLKLPPGPYEVPRLSPDGKRVAFGADDGKDAIIWIYDLSGTSAMRRLTFQGKNRFPIWSADGQRVVFQSDREGDLAVFWQRADGTGAAERLTKPDQGTSHVPESWSPKGDRFLFSVTKESKVSLWTFSLADGKSAPFDAVESSTVIGSVFSPDGRWVAYSSRETGRSSNRNIVYVQPFPATGAKYQITKNSEDGHHPTWSPDGKSLFYHPGPGTQHAVVRIITEPSFTISDATPVPTRFNRPPPFVARAHDIGPDGQFIGLIDADQSPTGTIAAPQIVVVQNWTEELKRLVPTR